jgi:hypothetical protein
MRELTPFMGTTSFTIIQPLHRTLNRRRIGRAIAGRRRDLHINDVMRSIWSATCVRVT